MRFVRVNRLASQGVPLPGAPVNSSSQSRRSLLGSLAWCLAHLPKTAGADQLEERPAAAPLYDLFAQDYDKLDDGAAASLFGFPELRQRILSSANGRVLECGGGTGASSSLVFLASSFPRDRV
jgi:hypothetical protein